MAKKKKKAEEPLSGQIPLEEVATTEKAETNNEPKKKKEKKVSRKNKKAAKKKAAAEEAAKAAAEEPVKEATKSAKKESRKEVPKEESKPVEKAVEEPLPNPKEEVAPAEEVAPTEEQQPTATAEETPAPKKKKQTKKSSKKKTEEPIAEELPIVEEPLSEPKEEVAPAEEQQPTATAEETPAPKKKKQSKKTSKKKEKAKPDSQSVESLLAVEIDAEKTLTLDEAFADIENQLKELEKGSEVTTKETAKKEKKSKKKKTEEEKSEVLSDEKPKRKSKKASEISLEETPEKPPEEAEENLSKEFSLPISQKVAEETLEDAVAEFSKSIGGEAPKKSFMKEFTIQLNKNSIKEETLGEPLAEEFYVKHDEHKFELPEKISDENIKELTLFDDGAKKSVETALEEPKSEESKSEEPESTSAEDDEATAKPLPSLGKLQDIKGEEIDDFIESVETFSEVSVPEKDSKKDSKVVQPKEPETADAHIKPLPRFLAHFVPVQGDGVGEIIRKGFVVICVVLLLVSMGILIDSTRKDDGGTDKSNENELNSYSENFAINNSDSGLPEGVLEKYHSLYNVNNDMVGWLTLPGTPIDMPVVQYTDNEYYETTDFNGNDLVGLVAYADAGSPMKTISRKTILYVSSGEGFGAISGLDDYKGFESLESKKDSFTLSFGTLYDDYEWEIIAGVLTDDVDDTIAKLSVEDFSAFSEYVLDETIYPRSLVSIKSGEKILMLCVPYTDTEAEDADSNEHLVLISKLLNRQSDD